MRGEDRRGEKKRGEKTRAEPTGGMHESRECRVQSALGGQGRMSYINSGSHGPTSKSEAGSDQASQIVASSHLDH